MSTTLFHGRYAETTSTKILLHYARIVTAVQIEKTSIARVYASIRQICDSSTTSSHSWSLMYFLKHTSVTQSSQPCGRRFCAFCWDEYWMRAILNATSGDGGQLYLA